MSRLKRVVIKEELVELTGDFKKAIVLNQMIYWSERVRDFDKFIEEEYQRAEANGLEPAAQELQNGWIYKKAEELAAETMMKVNQTTMSRCLNELVQAGWLDRRRNPKYKMDKTYQYRVNLIKIQEDLLKIGYHLEGYKANLSYMQNTSSNSPDTSSEMQNAYPTGEMPIEDAKCLSSMQNASAIPEITSESTSDHLRIINIEPHDKHTCSPVFVDKYLEFSTGDESYIQRMNRTGEIKKLYGITDT